MSITTINSWDALITTVFYKLLNSPVAHFYYKKSLQGSIHKNCARLAQLCRLLAQRIISRAQKLSMKAAYTTKVSHPYKHMLKVLSYAFKQSYLT